MSLINDKKELLSARANRLEVGDKRLRNKKLLRAAQQASRKPGADPGLGRCIEHLQNKGKNLDDEYKASEKRFSAACDRLKNPHDNVLRAPAGRQPPQAAKPGPQRSARPQRTAPRAQPSPAPTSRPGFFRRLTNLLFNRTR